MSHRYLYLAILAVFLVATATAGFALTSPSPKIESVLLDTNYLTKEGYLSGNTVPIIIMLNTPGALKTSQAEYQAKKNNVVNVLKNSLLPYKVKLDLKIIDGFSADVDLATLSALAASSDVKSIWLDKRGKVLLSETLPMLHISSTGGAWDSGYTGSGVNISIIDDGFNYTIAELGGCSQPINNSQCSKIPDSWNFINNNNDVIAGNGHGTKVAIIALGNSISTNGKGVAKDSKLLAYRVGLTESHVVAAINRSVSSKAQIISISIDIPSSNPNGPLITSVENAYSQGVLTVGAIGNDGTGAGVAYPGGWKNALGVGATYDASHIQVETNACTDNNVVANQLACWSSRGPADDGTSKPDVVAPGYKISTAAGAASAGTSFSTPHVAGIAAIVKQKHSAWNATQIKNKIVESSVNLSWYNSSWNYTVNEQGSGRVDAYNALDDTDPVPTLTSNASGNISYHTISLTYTCTDTNLIGDGNERTRFANENLSWAAWEWAPDVSGTKVWTLSSGEGLKTVYYQCKDKGGNVVEEQKQFTVDTITPTTTFSQNPQPNGNGWNNQTVTVTLTTNDANPWKISYRINEGSWTTVTSSSTSFSINDSGNHTIQYNSTDAAGNVEPTLSQIVRIDLVAPATTLTKNPSDPNGNNGWYTVPVTVTLTGVDSVSGVDITEYKINGGGYQAYSTPFLLGNGQHTITYRSKDSAGNVESEKTELIKIDTTQPIVNITSPSNGSVSANIGPLPPININPLSPATGNVIGTAIVAGRVVVEGKIENLGPSGANVTLYVNSKDNPSVNQTVVVGPSNQFKLTWNPPAAQVGNHVLIVTAQSMSGSTPGETQRVIVLVGSAV